METISKKEVVILVGFAFLFAIIIALYLYFKPGTVRNVPPPISPPVSLPSEGFKESVFEKLVPGKSTEEEAIKLFGEPETITEKNGNKYLVYLTTAEGFDNALVFKNGILSYSVENFFGDFKKTPDDYANLYGTPEFVLYDKNDEVLEWRAYPFRGIAIAIAPFENIIVKIVYFPPQSKEEFEKNFLDELQLSKEKVITPEGVNEITPAL